MTGLDNSEPGRYVTSQNNVSIADSLCDLTRVQPAAHVHFPSQRDTRARARAFAPRESRPPAATFRHSSPSFYRRRALCRTFYGRFNFIGATHKRSDIWRRSVSAVYTSRLLLPRIVVFLPSTPSSSFLSSRPSFLLLSRCDAPNVDEISQREEAVENIRGARFAVDTDAHDNRATEVERSLRREILRRKTDRLSYA